MPQTANGPTNMFRSLRPNNAEPRPSSSVAASDAEQRWPLLKAMPPREPQPTPALTTQEMQRWQATGSNEQIRPTTPQSPPGLGELLAQSLKQMSTRTSAEPKAQGNRPQPIVETPSQPAQLPSLAHLATKIKNTSPATVPEIKMAETEVILEAVLRSREPKVEPTPSDSTPADDSLKSVFDRLEGKAKQAASSIGAEKRPSYLGRLGKK
jgi:hypothetical protein